MNAPARIELSEEQQAEELKRILSDPLLRLSSLYNITDKSGRVIRFRPNKHQRRFIERLHTRNVILKARQQGYSTVIQLIMLDACLFVPNTRAAVIAQDLDAAETIFRDKIKFAYDQLPTALKQAIPLVKETTSELVFANNSAIKVTTSARSGTLQWLHVSEFGKIAAKYPDKATEIITGSFPAVAADGMIFVESTAEGADGDFFRMVQAARALEEAGHKLGPLDFKFHFTGWWESSDYRTDPERVTISPQQHGYFDNLEHIIDRRIEPEQRAWYIAQKQTLGDDDERMWREFPSTPDEAFQVSLEGTYYAQQLRVARQQGRITAVPIDPASPVNTFWDIGGNDETAIWLHQMQGGRHCFVRFHEASGESFGYFVRWLQSQECVWGIHYLPHDAQHKRQQGVALKSPKDMLEELAPGWRFEIVPRIQDVLTGIQQTRDAFALAWFDAEGCKDGLRHVEMYRKEWNDRLGTWKESPRHDVHSNGADALRQWGQTVAAGELRYNPQSSSATRRRGQRSWRVV